MVFASRYHQKVIADTRPNAHALKPRAFSDATFAPLGDMEEQVTVFSVLKLKPLHQGNTYVVFLMISFRHDLEIIRHRAALLMTLLLTTTLIVLLPTAAAVEHLHFTGHNLGGIAILTGLVLPLPSF